MRFFLYMVVIVFLLTTCKTSHKKGTYAYDLEFLQKHKNLIVLESESGKCQVITVPDYQGRVMTSTANGAEGRSYGWMHYDLISSGEFVEHYNPFGGEDRLWIGPEGGQYSIFFPNGSDFSDKDWNTPSALDTEPFRIIDQSKTWVNYQKKISLTNYQNFVFDAEITRKVSIFNRKEATGFLGMTIPKNIDFVAYQSKNTLKNIGKHQWRKDSGLLSIWILGMLNLSEGMTAILPYRGSLDLNTAYFGELGEKYVQSNDKAVFFRCDGKYRSKIGLPSKNAMPVCGSYDSEKQILTIVQYTFNNDSMYVNSLWRLQENPYGGDVVNSYNDGPMNDGSIMGPFYELETSSAAKELEMGESIEHTHRTFHFEGDFSELNTIAKHILGVNLNSIPF